MTTSTTNQIIHYFDENCCKNCWKNLDQIEFHKGSRKGQIPIFFANLFNLYDDVNEGDYVQTKVENIMRYFIITDVNYPMAHAVSQTHLFVQAWEIPSEDEGLKECTVKEFRCSESFEDEPKINNGPWKKVETNSDLASWLCLETSKTCDECWSNGKHAYYLFSDLACGASMLKNVERFDSRVELFDRVQLFHNPNESQENLYVAIDLDTCE